MRPAVAAFQNGGYGAVWQSSGQSGPFYSIYGRDFDPDNELPGLLSIVRQRSPAGLQFVVSFVGMGGRTYQLQSSGTLRDWTTVLATNPPDGTFTYTDLGSASGVRGFRTITP